VDRTLIDGVIVGTIAGKKFEVGVSSLPVVGDEVALALEEHLKIALSPPENKPTTSIGLFSETYLPVYFDLDQLLGKHTAIVGTTGCGKSYTVARLLQTIVDDYPGANIIVFDLHGEYRSCFEPSRYLRADQIKLPAWLHSFEDLFSLCADLSNQFNIHNQRLAFRDGIFSLKQNHCRNVIKDEELANNLDLDAPIPFNINHLLNYLHNLNNEMQYSDSGNPAYKDESKTDNKREKPYWFEERLEFKEAQNRVVKNGRLKGDLDRLVMRVESRLRDPRYAFMFKYDYPDGADLVAKIREITGFLETDSKPITIFDLSFLPSETVGTVVATISRIIFQVHFLAERQKHVPTLMVYEEAHNYISRHGKGAYGEARSSVERIAKEGRKFGVGSLVVSQRPSELSETLLSQCNTFLCMRLSNSQDKAYIEALLPDSHNRLVDILPALPQGHILAIGQASKMPIRVKVSEIIDEKKRPNSNDPQFGKQWRKTQTEREIPDIKKICDYWIRSKKTDE